MYIFCVFFFFFFFSSRRRHTRLQGDWSSDVCSSDLETFTVSGCPARVATTQPPGVQKVNAPDGALCSASSNGGRSEERRVGKECKTRWSPEHAKKKEESQHKDKEADKKEESRRVRTR